MNKCIKAIFLLVFLIVTNQVKAQKTYERLLEEDYYAEKALRYEDWTYEKKIRTVQLYPRLNRIGEKQQVPIIDIRSQRATPLVLEFDEFGDENDYYEVEILHCNSDWTRSREAAINYLYEYNEFNITEYDISINTKVPYIHYVFQVPPVKFSGNYILKVYREDDEEDIILTRRFIVYEQSTIVGMKHERVIGTTESLTRQQVNFTVDYSMRELVNPDENIKVVLRQNYRWDNAITDLEPNFNNQLRKTLQYNMNNLENTFLGGNEFRHIEFSAFRGGGFNLRQVISGDTINQVIVLIDKPKDDRAYDGQARDFNGQYRIVNRLTAQPETEADYAEVIFQLETGNQYTGDVYIVGSFSDWHLKEENKLTYAPAFGTYYATLILKQGLYDYMYVVEGAAPNSLEGNHGRAENEYDLIVYYRPIGSRGDRVIGYGVLR
ncbi:MAG: type IX secretion system plug protein domain-containing protein [Flammeovirgaceae bacterium]